MQVKDIRIFSQSIPIRPLHFLWFSFSSGFLGLRVKRCWQHWRVCTEMGKSLGVANYTEPYTDSEVWWQSWVAAASNFQTPPPHRCHECGCAWLGSLNLIMLLIDEKIPSNMCVCVCRPERVRMGMDIVLHSGFSLTSDSSRPVFQRQRSKFTKVREREFWGVWKSQVAMVTHDRTWLV